MTASNVLFIGNTGVGKSYLLNSIGGAFKSDFSSVDGLTAEITSCYISIEGSYVWLIDAPGLLEATGERMRNNARAITEALGFPGGFKLVFVLADNAGRVTPADLYTIGRVMSAIGRHIQLGVIINKVPEDDLGFYDDSETKEKIVRQLNSVAHNCFDTARFKAIQRYPKRDIHGAAVLVKELLRDMKFYPIPPVKNIAATMEELQNFVTVITSLSKGAKDYVVSHMPSRFGFRGIGDSDQQNKSVHHKDTPTSKVAEGTQGAERQAGDDQPNRLTDETTKGKTTGEGPDEHATRSDQPNRPTDETTK
ncbi:hypothetical protein DFQ26_004039, partial [Actinomortierella ambigua]